MLGFGNSTTVHDAYLGAGPWDGGFGDPAAALAFGDGEDVLWGHGDPPPFAWVLVWAWDKTVAQVGGEILTIFGDWPVDGPYTAQLVAVPSGQIYPTDAPGLREPPNVRAGLVMGRADPYEVRVRRRPYERTGGNPILPPAYFQVVMNRVPAGLYDLKITYQDQSQTVARLRAIPPALLPSAYRQRKALSPALAAGPRAASADPQRPPA